MFPKKKYQIIYADPPWLFRVRSEKGNKRSATNHYDVMSVQDIKDMPVQDIADENCILFLWVTFPNLIEGIDTIEAWGFIYKTCAFNWVKRNKRERSWFWGMGYWTRSNGEICLLATKGSPKRMSKSVHQIVDEPIREHSRKPDCIRERIVELCGDLPRIELFARQKTKGWDYFGNEIKHSTLEEHMND